MHERVDGLGDGGVVLRRLARPHEDRQAGRREGGVGQRGLGEQQAGAVLVPVEAAPDLAARGLVGEVVALARVDVEHDVVGEAAVVVGPGVVTHDGAAVDRGVAGGDEGAAAAPARRPRDELGGGARRRAGAGAGVGQERRVAVLVGPGVGGHDVPQGVVPVAGRAQAVGDAPQLPLVLGRHQRPDVAAGHRVGRLAIVAAGQADVDQDRVVAGLGRQVAVLKADPVGAAPQVDDDPGVLRGHTRAPEQHAHRLRLWRRHPRRYAVGSVAAGALRVRVGGTPQTAEQQDGDPRRKQEPDHGIHAKPPCWPLIGASLSPPHTERQGRRPSPDGGRAVAPGGSEPQR